MENKDDNSELDEYTQSRINSDIEKLNTEKELKIKWRNEFMSNEPFIKYLEGFRSGSSKSAIDSYLTIRYRWFQFGDLYKEIIDRDRIKWIDLAFVGLGAILQKKLFDLQCLWRANEITIASITISKSFERLGGNIFNCDFLEPITEDEIAMYQEYLIQGDFEFNDYEDFYDWQNYDEIKKSYHSEVSGSIIPSWYMFHNLRTGNSKLFLLPDSRGEKEKFYLDLFRKDMDENNPSKTSQENIITDTRPFFNIYEDEILLHILKTFDTKEAQKLYEYYHEGFEKKHDENEEYETIFNELLKVNEFVPIESHYNFKEALKNAYHRYKCQKIAEHIPIAYEQYMFNLQFGISAPSERNSISWDLLIATVENAILDGRELNGEPRDFDF